MRGRKLSPEQRRLIRERMLGTRMSPESIEKMRQTKLGKKMAPWTEERRAKYMAAWQAKRDAGYTRSDESRSKLSERQKLLCANPDFRKMLSEAGRRGAAKRWSNS
jgi:hypothetical protein